MQRSERNFRRKRETFSLSSKGTNCIPQKLEKSTHERKKAFVVSSFKRREWRSAAEEDSGALRTSRNPRSGSKRRVCRRSEEEEGASGGGSGGFGAPSNQQGSVGGLFSQPSSGVVGGFGQQQQQQQTGSGQLGGFGQPQQQTGGVSPGTSTFCKLQSASCVLIFNFPIDFVFFFYFFLFSLSRVTTTGFCSLFGDQRVASSFDRSLLTRDSFFLNNSRKRVSLLEQRPL